MQQKIYVGQSEDVKRRFAEHVSGRGAAWTKKYPPVKLIFETPGDEYDEDLWTKRMMAQFGINNVRGASYSNITLFNWQYTALTNELASAEKKCFTCKKPGHFAKDCGKPYCTRCERNNHTAEDCVARTVYGGKPIEVIPLSFSSEDESNNSITDSDEDTISGASLVYQPTHIIYSDPEPEVVEPEVYHNALPRYNFRDRGVKQRIYV